MTPRLNLYKAALLCRRARPRLDRRDQSTMSIRVLSASACTSSGSGRARYQIANPMMAIKSRPAITARAFRCALGCRAEMIARRLVRGQVRAGSFHIVRDSTAKDGGRGPSVTIDTSNIFCFPPSASCERKPSPPELLRKPCCAPA